MDDKMFNPGREMRIDRISALGSGPAYGVGTRMVIRITRALEPAGEGCSLVYAVHYENGEITVCPAGQYEAHYVRSALKSYED